MTGVPLGHALDEPAFGGKASALARALSAGLPVPNGIALSWDLVDAIAAGQAEARATALDLFESCKHPLSVRSSAIGEDSADASFAGQHATVLNVTTAEEFLAAVRRVHDSARTDSALEYRARVGVEGSPRIAVVLQQMVRPESAGVLFTRNPLTGDDERLVESAWGLGEAVVAGLVVPDRFRIARDGTILERQAGIKDIEIAASPISGAPASSSAVQSDVGEDVGAPLDQLTEERPVDSSRARALSLTDAQLHRLNALAARCESVFGAPQDIEWAFEGNDLFLLQSRPITRIIAPPAVERGEALPARRFAGLALAALLAPLNSTIIAVALPSIGTTFDADPATVTRWLITSYLLVSILAQSPAGKLADVWGYSRTLTAGRSLFGLGALVSVFAPNIHILAAGRVAMALGGALSIPTVMAELRNNTAPEKRGRLFGLFGAIMGTAAGVGPLLGGMLTARFGWHSIFVVNVPVVLLSLLLERPHRDVRHRDRTPIDFAGAAIFTIAIVAIVIAFERRDPIALVALGAGVLSAAFFIQRELRAPDPMLDVRLFAVRSFAAGSGIVALQNLAMYATLFLLPFLMAREARASAAGVAMMVMTAAMVAGSPVGGRLADHFGPRAIAVAGGIAATLGAILLYTSPISTSSRTLISLGILGVGLGLSTSPAQAAALSSIPRAKMGMASGALSTMRYLGGVIGSAIVGIVAAREGAAPLAVFIFPPVLLAAAAVALLLPTTMRHEPAADEPLAAEASAVT